MTKQRIYTLSFLAFWFLLFFLTRRQRSIIRRKWAKNSLRFILWGPLY